MKQYSQFTPYDWPQDTVRIPEGQGVMPAISTGNSVVIGQESTALGATFNYPVSQAAGLTLSAILKTDLDGDFWCDQIGINAYQYVTGDPSPEPILPVANISIQDIRTGHKLGYPDFMPVDTFRRQSEFDNGSNFSWEGSIPFPASYRSTSTLIQPFCFTRAGGISVTLQFPFANPNNVSYMLYVAFNGWKEYANAST